MTDYVILEALSYLIIGIQHPQVSEVQSSTLLWDELLERGICYDEAMDKLNPYRRRASMYSNANEKIRAMQQKSKIG